MKILFFGRDVRGGLGERRVFRVIINWLAENRPMSLRKNIELIPEYGRFDDLVSLIGTACESDALRTIDITEGGFLPPSEVIGQHFLSCLRFP